MQIKKTATVLICLILLVVSLCACSQSTSNSSASSLDSDIFGTWEEDRYGSGFTFNEDGTGYDIFWDLSFTYTTSSSDVTGEKTLTIKYDETTYGSADYTYEVNGSTLSMGLKDENVIYDYEKQ